jgi:hypothetical protein
MRAEANKKKRDIQEVTTNEGDEEPEKKAKSEKGGQNGSAFGRKAGKG